MPSCSARPLIYSKSQLLVPLSPHKTVYGARAPPSPHGDGQHALAQHHSYKGKCTLSVPIQYETQERRKEPPSRVQLGGSSGNKAPRRALRAQRPPSWTSHQQARGFFCSLGSWQPPCSLLAPSTAAHAEAPRLPSSLHPVGGTEMIYSGNLHCTAIKSLRGGDSICIPLPTTSSKSSTIHRQPPLPNHYCSEKEIYHRPCQGAWQGEECLCFEAKATRPPLAGSATHKAPLSGALHPPQFSRP